MENVRIINADGSHDALLSKLATETFSETFAHLNNPDDFNDYVTKSFNPNQLEQELHEKGSYFFLAYLNDELAGYARLRESLEVADKFPEKRIIELQRIYALKKFIGKGIGKALLNHCLRVAREKRFGILWLGVWEHNHHALKFYNHFGFEAFGSHDFMLGSDKQTDILMKIEL
jgi:diamine N-acetyltransferase